MSHYSDHDSVCTAEWVQANQERIASDDSEFRLVEVDYDTEVYQDWHIPGAVNIDWEGDLVNEFGGDLVGKDEVETLLGELGITPETTIILYGDKANWFAAHGYWVLSYYGHADVKLLDGGRRYWDRQDFETTTDIPDFSSREYTVTNVAEDIRAHKDDVLEATESEAQLIDVRNPQEYRGERPPAEIPATTDEEGHIPTAENVPWGQAVDADGTLKHPKELEYVYEDYLSEEDDTIAYCRIGERSSLTWFVLSELLDVDAKNYDGSWTEWAADAEMPIETSAESPEVAGDGGDDR